MEFRLIYDGPLVCEGDSDEKHKVRLALHPQLKQLWQISPLLRDWEAWGNGIAPHPVREYLANKFNYSGCSLIPLVFQEARLGCSLDILFLRYDQPGESLIRSGEIDNRLKTLFDGLRNPKLGEKCVCDAEQNPLYCLLEDDSMITHLSVTSDLLLEPNRTKRDVHLVITVKLWPVAVTIGSLGNIGF